MAPHCDTIIVHEHFDYSTQKLKLTLKEGKGIKCDKFAFTLNFIE